MKVVLLGYMGVGKTTIAKKLSKKVGIPHYDLDKMIENKEKMSINEIFESKGEIYFRKIEHELFKDFIYSKQNYILSVGGGTPCYANNHLLLKENDIVSIYLKDTISSLVQKLKGKSKKRPLLANLKEEELTEFVAKHLFERNLFYLFAKKTVEITQKSKDEVVSEIINLFG